MAITVTTTYTTNTNSADATHGLGAGGTAGAMGSRNKTSLQGIFSASPIVGYAGAAAVADQADMSTSAALKLWFFNNVIKGTDSDGGGAYGLGIFDKDFGAAKGAGLPTPPNLSTSAMTLLPTEGKPATGFVPNPTSPGEGNFGAGDKAAAPEAFISELTADGAAFVGQTIVEAQDLAAQAAEIVSRQGPAASPPDAG